MVEIDHFVKVREAVTAGNPGPIFLCLKNMCYNVSHLNYVTLSHKYNPYIS